MCRVWVLERTLTMSCLHADPFDIGDWLLFDTNQCQVRHRAFKPLPSEHVRYAGSALRMHNMNSCVRALSNVGRLKTI